LDGRGVADTGAPQPGECNADGAAGSTLIGRPDRLGRRGKGEACTLEGAC